MEVVGLTIGVVSIASIFQTCLHGYRSLNVAMGIGNSALTLNIQFRVEEIRLYLWGRNWGLVGESEKTTIEVGSVDQADLPMSSSGSTFSPVSTDLDLVDEEFEIPGLRDLTIEILGRVQAGLEEWKMVGERYGAAPTPTRNLKKATSALVAPTKSSSFSQVSEIGRNQQKQQKDISDANRLTAKLRWAMKDKPVLDELLAKLTNLNDSLEKLLPRRERTSLARGLTGEILNILESEAKASDGPNIGDQLARLQGVDEIKAAKIIQLKQLNRTQMPEVQRTTEKDDKIATDGPTPFSTTSEWVKGAQGSMEISSEHILRLKDQKLQYYETSHYAPLPRSMAIYSPIVSGRPARDHPAQAILVEWRPAKAESEDSELTNEELRDRRDHIARLLHRTSTTDADFGVLDCIGYTMGSGHTPDGSTHELVGYVYQYPDFASPRSLPVSLRQLLGAAFDSSDPSVPALEERFKLARRIAVALYQLQCAGWIHRKISSYNVIFFHDRSTNELKFEHPYLVGWQYARPDDHRLLHPSESSREGIGDLDMYVHRDRLLGRNRSRRLPRFRKSFDIYSLGIILMEIAFWEPIMALASEIDREKMAYFGDIESGDHAKEWWESISKTAKRELAPEMGAAYRDAVLFCLFGYEPMTKKYDEDNDNYFLFRLKDRKAYVDDLDFEQIGLEKEFYWKVLNALERFRT